MVRAFESVRARTGTAAQTFRSLKRRVSIWVLDWRDARDNARTLQTAARPSIQERRQELAAFYDRYEQLVETLCDAAQYGPEPGLDARYGALRTWMQQNYRNVRPYVAAYLEFEPSDVVHGLEASERTTDGFEALFHASNLREFLSRDDGAMIGRIIRTRRALTLYGDHLRQLGP